MYKSKDERTAAIINLIVILIVGLFIAPWLSFWCAYFAGWIAKLVIGKYLVEAFSVLGITIPLDKIPLIAGFVGWICGFRINYKTERN